jgi:hypothetical protein
MKKQMKGNKRTGTYEFISDNVYYDGTSYRVRVSVNGTRVSKNFSSKKAALAFRKLMLKEQEQY